MLVRSVSRTWERRDTTTDVGVGSAVRFTRRRRSHDLFVRGSDVGSTTRHDGSGSECFLLVFFLRLRATRTRGARLDGTGWIRIHDETAWEHTHVEDSAILPLSTWCKVGRSTSLSRPSRHSPTMFHLDRSSAPLFVDVRDVVRTRSRSWRIRGFFDTKGKVESSMRVSSLGPAPRACRQTHPTLFPSWNAHAPSSTY